MLPLHQTRAVFAIGSVTAAIAAALGGLVSCGAPRGAEDSSSLTRSASSRSATAPALGTRVQADFDVSINPYEGALRNKGNAAPSAESVSIAVKNQRSGSMAHAVKLHIYAKDAPARNGVILAEVFIENTLDVPLEKLVVRFGNRKGGVFIPLPQDKGVFDWTVDPFVDETTQEPLALDRVGARGMASAWIGIPHQFAGTIAYDVEVRAEVGKGEPQTARTLALTPDDAELWSAYGDGNTVAIIDTKTNETRELISLPGRPSGIALTPDGALALVTLAESNQVAVIDVATRKVLQTLGEADGLGRELRSIVLSPEGDAAYVSGYVTDDISVLRRVGKEYSVEKSVAVGRRPSGLSVSADGSTLYVAHFLPRSYGPGGLRSNEAWISLVDTKTFEVKESVLRDQFNRDNTDCVKKSWDNPFIKLRTGEVKNEEVEMEGIFSQMAGVFLNPNGTRAWLPGVRVAGGVQVWESGPNAAKDVGGLVTFQPGELAIPIVLMMDTRGKMQLRPEVMNGFERPVEGKYSRCMAFEREFDFTKGDRRKTKPSELVSRLATYPTGMSGLSEMGLIRSITYTKGGRRALLLSPISDEIAVQDALTGHPTSVSHLALSGANPSGLVLTRDGKRGFVNYENSPDISMLDTSAFADDRNLPLPSYVPYEFKHSEDVPQIIGVFGQPKEKWLTRDASAVPEKPWLKEVGVVRTGITDSLDAEMRRGKILFSSSNPEKYPVSQSRAGACASCHPGGGNDGSAWSTMEGERRTLNLRGGIAGRGWLHASATHKDAHEFVETVVKERLGGTLDEKDTRALARYVAFGVPKLQSPRVDLASAARGEKLFATSCTSCHTNVTAGSGNADLDDEWGGGGKNEPMLYDIGSGVDVGFVTLGVIFERLFPKPEAALLKSIRGDKALGSSDYAQQVLDYRPRPERKKGEFKAPPLVNVWDNAVFFHHGHIGTLDEAVREIEARLAIEYTPAEHDDMVNYLKTL